MSSNNDNNNKDENDFDESDEEYPRGEFGSSKWSSTSSSLSSSAENEQTTTPLVAPKQELLDPNLVDYLLENKEQVSLDSIKAIQELLSELRLSQPNKDAVEHISELRAIYFAHSDTDDLRRELEEVKKSKRLIETKFQISKKVHVEELKSMDNSRMEELLKNSGGKEYVQTLRDRVKLKEESIAVLNKELDHLRKEVESLRDRCTRATKLSNHYYALYKDSEAARVKLETVPMTREQRMNNDRMLFVTSPANSLDDSQVPPPPPMDMPNLDEIMRNAKSPPLMSMHALNNHQAQPHHDSRDHSSANNSQYNSLDLLNNSIPPPPLEDVDLDELFGTVGRPEQPLPSLGSM